ncbi:hypothetical protein [Pseudomonas sp. StFLB209]|uniref:hypothetical protein n=1 Tax=Pseudomonas sp. StFLB209 TaxID=1028989 RepID=UPI001184A41F|nr:hypothetical protein [Pseudomonas sp. StFLB209]
MKSQIRVKKPSLNNKGAEVVSMRGNKLALCPKRTGLRALRREFSSAQADSRACRCSPGCRLGKKKPSARDGLLISARQP